MEHELIGGAGITAHTRLMGRDDAARRIEEGAILMLAGSPEVLRSLPNGKWVGGTIHYFMDHEGGRESPDQVLVTELPRGIVERLSLKVYTVGTIRDVASEAPDNGFSFLILPAMSEIHLAYAENAPGYRDMFIRNVVGWVSGVHLDRMGEDRALVFNGVTGESWEDRGVSLQVTLKSGYRATISMVNPVSMDESVSIEFPRAGFSARTAMVNGEDVNFAEWVRSRGFDTRMPLVADYAGARVNVAIAEIKDDGAVTFYAPVFPDTVYHPGVLSGDYLEAFSREIPKDLSKAGFLWTCNCVLNYLHMNLEGRRISGHDEIAGPMTFGEIAWQLLNQTMVYLRVDKA